MNIQIINNPQDAIGTTIVIDVFRAFSVEPYLINNNVKELIAIGDEDIAYKYKENNPEVILIGERKGIKLPNFNYGNSPYEIKNIDFTGKTVLHTTSCGTQGIVNSVNADEILTGSLINAKAIAEYINKTKPKNVSILAIQFNKQIPPEPEDELCARYIKSLIEKTPLNSINEEIENLKSASGKRFFAEELQNIFPKEDFYLCTELNKFDFVLKAHKKQGGLNYIEKI